MPSGSNADRPPLPWPRELPAVEAETVSTRCARCEQSWRIHRDLCGYRLRCICTGWVPVPYPPAVVESAQAVVSARHEQALLSERSATREVSRARIAAPSTRSREPADRADLPLEDEFFPTEPSARQIDRSILEIVALAIAFIAPGSVFALLAGVDVLYQWLPVVSLSSGVLVLLVGIASGQFGFEALRGARPIYFLEGIAAAAIGVGFAWGWTWIVAQSGAEMSTGLDSLVETLGLPLALFAISLCPAIFEELAFRGIIQGRLIGLLGKGTAIPLTALLFTFAHGVSVASPIHLLLGLELGYLRQRSGSLYPGMILHGLYNGVLVAMSV